MSEHRTAVRLSPARERVLRTLIELGPQPVTLNEVAASLGGHPNTSRQHLDILVEDHLVDAIPIPRSTPGRRPLGFSITDSGREALASPSASNEYRELVGAFATYLVDSGAESDARSIGEMWGKNRSHPMDGDDPVDALVEMLDILGFDPARTSTEAGEAVVLRTCPLINMISGDPEVMCELHQGMIDGVMQTVGASEGVKLIPFHSEHGCRLEVSSRRPQPIAAPTRRAG